MERWIGGAGQQEARAVIFNEISNLFGSSIFQFTKMIIDNDDVKDNNLQEKGAAPIK